MKWARASLGGRPFDRREHHECWRSILAGWWHQTIIRIDRQRMAHQAKHHQPEARMATGHGTYHNRISDPSKIKQSFQQETTIVNSRLVVCKEWKQQETKISQPFSIDKANKKGRYKTYRRSLLWSGSVRICAGFRDQSILALEFGFHQNPNSRFLVDCWPKESREGRTETDNCPLVRPDVPKYFYQGVPTKGSKGVLPTIASCWNCGCF